MVINESKEHVVSILKVEVVVPGASSLYPEEGSSRFLWNIVNLPSVQKTTVLPFICWNTVQSIVTCRCECQNGQLYPKTKYIYTYMWVLHTHIFLNYI